MTETKSARVVADAPGARLAAILLTTIGMDVFIMMPGFVQGLVVSAGLTDQQSGYVASGEMFGIAVSTLAMAWLIRHVSWRGLAFVGLLIGVFGNAGAAQVGSVYGLIAIRTFVGLGSGVLISLGYGSLGFTAKPDRNFGIVSVVALSYGALALWGMPTVLRGVGFHGMLYALAAISAAGMLVIRFIPSSSPQTAVSDQPSSRLSVAAYLILAAFGTFFLGMGEIWTYLGLIGSSLGATDQYVADALMIAQLLGVIGALLAATFGGRIKYSLSVTYALLLSAGPLLFFVLGTGLIGYKVGACTFNAATNFVTPIMMAIAARYDRTGRVVVLAVSLEMLALALGPALAASVITPGDYSRAVWIAIVLFVLCWICLLPVILGRLRPEPNATALEGSDSLTEAPPRSLSL